MECPYCKKEMQKGEIPGDRSAVRWFSEEMRGETCARKDVRLSPPSFLTGGAAEAWYCEDCRMVIVPVKEFEEIGDKIFRKVNDLAGKATGKLEEARTRREADKREKKREANRKKDPWEID